MVLSVAGNCLILTFFGVSTIVSPAIGQAYLAGQQGAVGVNEAIFGSALVPLISGPGLLLYLVGTILLGVAVWRSRTLPKWAGALYAPTGVLLLAGQFVGASQTLAMLLLIASSVWIAWSVMRHPSAEAVDVGAQQRVK